MRKSIYIAVAIVMCGVVYAAGDSLLHSDEPDLTTCERALTLLSRGDRAGFDVLFEQWPDKSEAGKATTEEFADAQAPGLRSKVKTWGEPLGIELVSCDEVGSFLRRYTYVCKYQRARISYTFTFYKPADAWRFDGYHFETDDNALFLACGHGAALPESSMFSIAGKPKAAAR